MVPAVATYATEESHPTGAHKDIQPLCRLGVSDSNSSSRNRKKRGYVLNGGKYAVVVVRSSVGGAPPVAVATWCCYNADFRTERSSDSNFSQRRWANARASVRSITTALMIKATLRGHQWTTGWHGIYKDGHVGLLVFLSKITERNDHVWARSAREKFTLRDSSNNSIWNEFLVIYKSTFRFEWPLILLIMALFFFAENHSCNRDTYCADAFKQRTESP